DQARHWVRNLRLRNPTAKAILQMAANYMNEDGSAWPSLETLARDTEFSEDTIASRLKWADTIGVISLIKNWIDEHGTRNREGNGRPTSSEIRFMLDGDVEEIEAKALASSKPHALRGAARASHEGRCDTDNHGASPNDSDDSGISDRSQRTLTEGDLH